MNVFNELETHLPNCVEDVRLVVTISCDQKEKKNGFKTAYQWDILECS